MSFDFEKFPVYKAAVSFIQDINDWLETISVKENMRLVDQLQRASSSIALNIAEGAGRYHKADKRNFYIIARGSVYECVACLEIFLTKRVLTKQKHEHFYMTLNELAKQLSAMIR